MYYSQRQGRNQPDPMDLDRLRVKFKRAWNSLADGHFQPAFGKYCVDDGYSSGWAGLNLPDTLVDEFGAERGARLNPNVVGRVEDWSKDDLLDMIEFVHKYVAEPTDSYYHKWDNCGIHVTTWSADHGQANWREFWNPVLAELHPPYRLMPTGCVENLPDDSALTGLVDAPLDSGEPEVDARVDRAIRKFFGRSATADDHREAVRDLADVLEKVRPGAKDLLTSNDEGRLFEIANCFLIRHYNEKQRTEYGREEFMPFIFYA